MIFTRKLWQALFWALTARPAATLLSGNLLLFTNNVTPGPDTVLADLTEPTYTSYVRQAATFTGPFRNAAGNEFVHIGDVTFTLAPGDAGVTIQGAAIVDGGGNLLIVGKFAAPVDLVTTGDTVIVSGDPGLTPSPDMSPWVVEP